MYSILYSGSSILKKDIADIRKNLKLSKKIQSALESFSLNPLEYTGNIKKLEPKGDNLYRIRIGDYRIILSVDYGNKNIIVHRIALRKDIYN